MDAFEKVIGQILDYQDYWTRISFKVELTKEEKVEMGRPTTPRWELDVVGYKASINEVLVVECKSYLNSPGVHVRDFDSSSKLASRYKLFVEPQTREVVFRRLALQLTEKGLCAPKPVVRLALAAGKIAGSEAELGQLFENAGFVLFTPDWICEGLSEISAASYDNEVASVVAKLLLRRK